MSFSLFKLTLSFGSVKFLGKKGSLQTIFQLPVIGRLFVIALCHWSSVFWPPVICWALAMSHQWVIMLSSTELCYRPYVIVERALLPSNGLCYLPQSYNIVHRAMLSSTELCHCPKGYVIVHMLSSTELCYRSYVIVHRAMLLSKAIMITKPL